MKDSDTKCIYVYPKSSKRCKYKRKPNSDYCGHHKTTTATATTPSTTPTTTTTSTPLKDKIVLLDTTLENKLIVMRHYNNLRRLDNTSTEYYKNYMYLERIASIPWGITKTIDGVNRDALLKIKASLDSNIHGMNNVKEQILNYIARMLLNPDSKRNILGLHGLAGNGKTRLVYAIAEALKRPIKTISLGGVKDSSYFLGHGYIYVESGPGAIVQSLIDSKCMNPIMYFDELDKVSENSGGKDIYSFLTYLTDATQNHEFSEHYFHGLKFDMSRVFYIFTFNDKEKIDKILLDRINLITVPEPSTTEKCEILYSHCLPEILKNTGLKGTELLVTRDNVQSLVNSNLFIKDPSSTGIRELYRILEMTIMEYNKSKILDASAHFDFERLLKMTVESKESTLPSWNTMYI
jgi:ATP-dependent Lon protease